MGAQLGGTRVGWNVEKVENSCQVEKVGMRDNVRGQYDLQDTLFYFARIWKYAAFHKKERSKLRAYAGNPERTRLGIDEGNVYATPHEVTRPGNERELTAASSILLRRSRKRGGGERKKDAPRAREAAESEETLA